MSGLDLAAMQDMQRELHEKYDRIWGEIGPAQTKDKLLWTYGELAEVGDILKKQGVEAVLNDPQVRAHFVEELCDVLMYLNDVCICTGVTPEEVEAAYREKHRRNMTRW